MSGDDSTNSSTHPDGTGYWRLSRALMRLDGHGHAAIFKPHSDLVLFDLHMSSLDLDGMRKEMFPSLTGTNESGGSCEGSMPDIFSSVSSWSNAQQSGANKKWKGYSPRIRGHVEALLRAAELAKLSEADDSDKNIARDICKKNSIVLTGEDKALYEESSTDYLVVLKPDPYREFVSSFIANKIIRKYPRLFARLFGRVFDQESTDMKDIDQFSNSRIQILASMIITVFASIGLAVNAVGLYYTRAIGSKLGMILGFSVLHALFLSLFSGPVTEAVTSLSTWAAVQIFFITATEDSNTVHTTNGTTCQP